MAHCGCPWFLDAAEVAYKNNNVWIDVSGLLVGDKAAFDAMAARGTLERTGKRLLEALYYTEKPSRFLYGSDWPLVPMASYREFMASVVPEAHHQAVFEDNARELFDI